MPTLAGGTEPVWIYVATPAGPGPHPVVVYGHGQGVGNVVNCTPDRAPDDDDARSASRIADALAGEGYLTVAIFYRNRGATIPAAGELRGRDHYLLDARAFLAAAQLAHDRLGGDSRAALIGVSMGSFPATWATAPRAELADLQTGLDLVTTIPTAMLGNHIGNTGRSKDLLATPDLATRRTGIALAGLASVGPRTALALDPSLIAGDLAGDAAGGLTAAGAELVRRVFVDAPDASLPGCNSLPAACSSACLTSTFDAVAASRGLTDVTASDWLTQDTLDAIDYWDPPTAIDPGATDNVMLSRQRELSPAYSLTGPLRTRRMLPLTSIGDHVVTGQLAGSNAAAELYLARLRATGVTLPDVIPVVSDAGCDHGDYLDPSRPQCGWNLVLDELATAFAAD
ncbi:MAG: hypothetical protein ABI867_28105 [Kofleriaceae bacterium]